MKFIQLPPSLVKNFSMIFKRMGLNNRRMKKIFLRRMASEPIMKSGVGRSSRLVGFDPDDMPVTRSLRVSRAWH